MNVTVEKLTDITLLRKACESTMQAGKTSAVTLDVMYRCEHSPIRTQLFWITMDDVPTFVSVHCVRHKIGIEHFVRSNRPDRGGDGEANRQTPIMHSVLVNAESLINMAKKRLCHQAHQETRKAMLAIKEAVHTVDPDLARYMVPQCIYRGGYCQEMRPCGKYRILRYDPDLIAKMVEA